MKTPRPLAALARSTAVHVAVAALAMGGWAAFANRDHGAAHALTAGAVQGVLSGLITLFLKRGLEAMAPRFPGALAAVVPPSITCVVVLIVLVTTHTLARTPEIVRTIAVPYAVSSLYAWVYSYALYRSRQRSAA